MVTVLILALLDDGVHAVGASTLVRNARHWHRGDAVSWMCMAMAMMAGRSADHRPATENIG